MDHQQQAEAEGNPFSASLPSLLIAADPTMSGNLSEPLGTPQSTQFLTPFHDFSFLAQPAAASPTPPPPEAAPASQSAPKRKERARRTALAPDEIIELVNTCNEESDDYRTTGKQVWWARVTARLQEKTGKPFANCQDKMNKLVKKRRADVEKSGATGAGTADETALSEVLDQWIMVLDDEIQMREEAQQAKEGENSLAELTRRRQLASVRNLAGRQRILKDQSSSGSSGSEDSQSGSTPRDDMGQEPADTRGNVGTNRGRKAARLRETASRSDSTVSSSRGGSSRGGRNRTTGRGKVRPSDVTTNLMEVVSSLSGMASQIGGEPELGSRIDRVEGELSTIGDELSSMGGNISTLGGEISTIKGLLMEFVKQQLPHRTLQAAQPAEEADNQNVETSD